MLNREFRRLLKDALNGPGSQRPVDHQANEGERSASEKRLYRELRKRGFSDEEIEEERSRVLRVMKGDER